MIVMQRHLYKPNRKLYLLFGLLYIFSQSSLFSQVTTYTSGTGTYTVPADVHSIVVEVVGGGGRGGRMTNNGGGGGGGGGVSPTSSGTGYTASTSHPSYKSILWNFNPSVNFSNGYFRANRGSIQDDMTFFYIYGSTQTTNNSDWWKSPAIIGNEADGTDADFGLGHNNGRLFFKSAKGDNFDVQTPSNKNFNDGVPKIVTATRKKATNGINYIYVNGSLEGSGASDNVSLSNAGYIGIGRNPTVAESQFSGYISEAIGKSYLANTSERYIYESYLAIKYGITLPYDYKREQNNNDCVVYTVAGFGNDIAGLGRCDFFGLNQKISSSVNIASGSSRIVVATNHDFTASNLDGSRTALADDQYLIWGHNNGTTTTWNDISGTNYKKVNRVWRSQNTGNVGAVAPGQYLAIPKNLAGFNASTAVIPSMQGFMVVVNDRDNPPLNGKLVNYNYANSIGNTQQQRAPRPEAPEYVATVVTLTGAEQFDRAWMFTDDRCTADFDNGWDGKKIVSEDDNLSISMLQNQGEKLQIHATDNINSTYIIVQPKPEISDIYTLHFKHTHLEAEYNELLLYDLANQEQINISADGSTHSFLVDKNDTKERHFKILTKAVNYNELDVVAYAHEQKLPYIII